MEKTDMLVQSEGSKVDIALIQRDVVAIQKDIAILQKETAELQKEALLISREALLIPQDIVFIKKELSGIKDCLTNKYVTVEAFDPVRKIVYGLVGITLLTVVGAVIALAIKGV